MIDTSATPLLQFDNVSRIFDTPRGQLPAVDRVSFDVPPGEVLCLVGESGCGKTTTGKMAAMLLRPTSGRVLVEGKDIWRLPEREFKGYRKAIQLIHQDPYASLNPVHSVADTLAAPLLRHKVARSRRQAVEKSVELLQIVGLTPPEDFLSKYPHQLSGGQRQRVSVARALTVEPRLIVADESVSMVDVSMRVSLLNMLLGLKDRLGVTFLFITHDLAVARYFAAAGRIGVMYLGRMVELGPAPRVIEHPEHPYTKALLIPKPSLAPSPRPIRCARGARISRRCAASRYPACSTCRPAARSTRAARASNRACATWYRRNWSPLPRATPWPATWPCANTKRRRWEGGPSQRRNRSGWER